MVFGLVLAGAIHLLASFAAFSSGRGGIETTMLLVTSITSMMAVLASLTGLRERSRYAWWTALIVFAMMGVAGIVIALAMGHPIPLFFTGFWVLPISGLMSLRREFFNGARAP